MSHDLTTTTVDGERTALVLPTIPEDAPAVVREGIARRRLTATTGRCPCGATFQLPNRAERRAAKRSGRALHVTVVHEHDCPAASDNIHKIVNGGAA